jgi:HAD superfamily hydrolase (TIGR01509 family)
MAADALGGVTHDVANRVASVPVQALKPATARPPFRAVIFDMDGLLIDSERPILEAWLQASLEHDRPIEREVYLQVLGRTGPDGRAFMKQLLGEGFPYESVRERVQALIAQARQRDGHVAKAGAAELLARLQALGLPLAVASSTFRAEVDARLASAGLARYFNAVAGGDEVVNGKPSPDVFLLAAQRIAADPAHCLVFEDSSHGARGALAAGMAVVVVPDLKHPDDELAALSLEVLPSLVDVLAHWDDWFVTAG